MTKAEESPINRTFHRTGVYAIMSWMILAIIVIFLLGIGNFALHSAVLDSGHPLVGQMPRFVQALGGRLTLVAEFIVLLAAMLLSANGWPGLVWAYGVYSVLNALSAWLILSRKI
jgi:hypothetical protein